LSRPLSSVCLWTVFRITFTNSLPIVDKRLIECKFLGNFGSLLGFGNGITFASFQGFGKCNSRRQWLNKCVRCIIGLLGRCLRHSFGELTVAAGPHCISLCSDQIEDTVLSCCITIYFHRNVFTALLPYNGCIFMFHYFGFQVVMSWYLTSI
jgi:hypothetical protein